MDLTREKDVVAKCDRLATAVGFEVCDFSDTRRVRTTPCPDRYYRHVRRGLRLWFEVKHPDDKLTREQYAFIMSELDAGGLASCGTDTDLQTILSLSARVPAGAVARRCREIVAVWALKGYRGERKDGKPYGSPR